MILLLSIFVLASNCFGEPYQPLDRSSVVDFFSKHYSRHLHFDLYEPNPDESGNLRVLFNSSEELEIEGSFSHSGLEKTTTSHFDQRLKIAGGKDAYLVPVENKNIEIVEEESYCRSYGSYMVCRLKYRENSNGDTSVKIFEYQFSSVWIKESFYFTYFHRESSLGGNIYTRGK